MKPPETLGELADTYYPHTGPDARGTTGWYLWSDHMFRDENDGFQKYVGFGVPVKTWLERWRDDDDDPRYREIIADLEKRGY